MARISRKIPKARDLHLFETNQKNKLFKWIEITADPIGELQLKQAREWVSDDGFVFRSAETARDYFVKRRKDRGRTIKPGEYKVDFVSVTSSPDHVEIKLHSGEKIIIKRG